MKNSPGSLPRLLRNWLARIRPGAVAPTRERRGERGVTVVIPVYNAFAELQSCLDSLVRNTSHPVTLLLIDDASPDERIGDYLQRLQSANPRVQTFRNPENLGFVKTVNRGLAASGSDDVILLNSDTEVPPRWVQNLLLAARDPNVGTVTAVSNNAGAFSAPERNTANVLPADIDRTGRAVAQVALHKPVEVHTGHAFCMFIKREVIEQTGLFDEQTFGRGYCEENDFCMRARAHGWKHVIDDAVLVAHHGSSSFAQEKTALLKQNRQALSSRHPEYDSLVQSLLANADLAAVRERVGLAFRQAADTRPRILFVLHGGQGGTPYTNRDLMRAVSHSFEPLLLVSSGNQLVLSDGVSGIELKRYDLPNRLATTTFADSDYADAIREILTTNAIELVHIRHVHDHTFELPELAAGFGIPVVLSFHDFYLVCPSIHLLDQDYRFCAGQCTAGPGECPTPYDASIPDLKHGFVHEWRRRATQLIAHCDAFVTTSNSAAAILTANFPQLREHLHVIEHGRDLQQETPSVAPPEPGQPARILVPGTVGIHKGAALIAAICELDIEERLEFHLIGSFTDKVARPARLIDHGRYERGDFAALTRRIAPAATAVLSVWAETYSHTVTESWSVGVPVLGSSLGAVGERIRQHGGGWVIDTSDPAVAYRQILAALFDRDAWERARQGATVNGLPGTADMAAHYVALYRDVLRQRQVLLPA